MRPLLLTLCCLVACNPGERDPKPGDTTETGETGAETTACDTLGLPVRAFVETAPTDALNALAADLTVPTTLGDWSLQANWTGCEVYLFVQEEPKQNRGLDTEDFWSRDVDDLLARSPRNARWFFLPSDTTSEEREEALTGLQAEVDEALAGMSAEDAAWWTERIHYVTARHVDIEGWPRDLMVSPGWGFGIDRFQRIRYIGSYGDPERYNSSVGWFDPNLSMAANEALYWNHEAAREERLAAQDAEVFRLFDGDVVSDPGWAGVRSYVDLPLPDPADLAAFDALELDLTLACEGDGEYGDCPPWDYIDWLWLCDAEDPDTCDQEMGRWITTYHREGRWVHDVSPLLPLLQDGGTRRFAFYSQQAYEVTLDLRFIRSGRETRPTQVTHLFTGGHFDADYNDAYSPVEVEIPAGARAVKLATVVSGHGMSDPGNCAEFCNTEHHFGVNGEDNVISFPDAGTTWGCMETVGEGTVPNQYGTWWYGRGGWCPGREVPMTITDVTAQVTPGETATFTYAGYYRGAPYTGGSADIRLEAWVVVEE